jgi:hypothetical protein
MEETDSWREVCRRPGNLLSSTREKILLAPRAALSQSVNRENSIETGSLATISPQRFGKKYILPNAFIF